MSEEYERIFSLLDLTSLNAADDSATIAVLCNQAVRASSHVAAVCVYPLFIQQVKKTLADTSVKIATVANFPRGADSVAAVVKAIQAAIHEGAEEIDVVFPYQSYLAGEKELACDLVRACKQTCGETILLKVILETGALQDKGIIAAASQDVLLAGADFLKTSTGKIAIGATLEAAEVMLGVIKRFSTSLQRPVGLKVAGGIRDVNTAMQYIKLVEEMMGKAWVKPRHFRIGASRLLNG